jgi:Replication protein A OB domain/Replication factor-A C terminal domain
MELTKDFVKRIGEANTTSTRDIGVLQYLG